MKLSEKGWYPYRMGIRDCRKIGGHRQKIDCREPAHFVQHREELPSGPGN